MKLNFQMKPFLTAKRKMYELLFLLGLSIPLYFIFKNFNILMLFILGFIWNWAASQEVPYVLEGYKYRFSMLRMVYNLQKIFLKPFSKFPPLVKIIPKILPAGLFWLLVIHFAESELPWWPTFLGSLVYELTQLDLVLVKRSELPPEIIP